MMSNISFSAKQLVQLQKHKTLYNSVNQYSREIASTSPGLSPLVVLKTAIQLHQREPKPFGEAVHSKSLPLMQEALPSATQLYDSQTFQEKLQQLKTVLPSSSDVKLAALLNREKGDLNAVVQYILEEPVEYESISETLGDSSIIDLTDDQAEPPRAVAYEDVLSCVGGIETETSTLANILQTVKEKESTLKESSLESSSAPCTNLLSFHHPKADAQFGTEANENSKQLSEMSPTLKSSSNQDQCCPYCKVKRDDFDKFCRSCGGVFHRNIRW